VGPRADLDTVVKRKIPSPRREWNPRTPIVQPVVALEIYIHKFKLQSETGQFLEYYIKSFSERRYF
jgi:hypothetical protein